MANQRKNYMKATVWTENLKVTFEGGIVGGVVDTFGYLTLEQQKKAMAKMQEILERRTAKEAENIQNAQVAQ